MPEAHWWGSEDLELGWNKKAEKLGFITHYHNRITVANKAGLSAPMVAFGKDPSLFPLWAGPCCLKKIYPLFPLSRALPDCNKRLDWHTWTQTCTSTHSMLIASGCVCLHVHTHVWPVPQHSAWPAHQKGLHLHNSNKILSAPCPSLVHPPFHFFCHPAINLSIILASTSFSSPCLLAFYTVWCNAFPVPALLLF